MNNSLLIVLFGVLLCGLPGPAETAYAQPGGPSDEVRADSLARAYHDAVRSFKTAELERRMSDRRSVQRSGYCQTLAGVVRRNGLDALLAYIRMRLHLDFSLPHDQLVAYFPSRYRVEPTPGVPGVAAAPNAMTVVPLYEDRTFPRDPWRRE